ncbi:hypothetical protein GCM10009700_34750 [Brevibacterium sanguinis]
MWLTMMRDRLEHMQTLLCEDGSIWVRLHEAESHRMRALQYEEFGPSNFVAEIDWHKTYSPGNRAAITHIQDTILAYV